MSTDAPLPGQNTFTASREVDNTALLEVAHVIAAVQEDDALAGLLASSEALSLLMDPLNEAMGQMIAEVQAAGIKPDGVNLPVVTISVRWQAVAD